MGNSHPSRQFTIPCNQRVNQVLVFPRYFVTAVTEDGAEVEQPLTLVEYTPNRAGKAAIASGIGDCRVERVISVQITLFALGIVY